MSHVICFGELLLRFSPALNGDWLQTCQMPVHVGGAELNVARALAHWHTPVGYSSVVPTTVLGDELVAFVEQQGVDTTGMLRSADRIGTYYLPQGADLKSTGVIYDRAESGFARRMPNQTDWDTLLGDADWLHISAISPALTANAAAVCLELVQTASAKGITISIDLNYRANLWQYGVSPQTVMPGLVEYCDIVMGNIWAANSLLGIPLADSIREGSTQAGYLAHALTTAQTIQERFPRCKAIANTFRFDDPPTGLRYYTTLYSEGQQYVSNELYTSTVVDRVGSGDCYMAGLIYGFRHQLSPQQIVGFATQAAFGKLQESGDATRQTVKQIQARATGSLSYS
ncbi:2-dehydro-3-deoxygluconokinase [Spirosoma oryzae]|uniref:2-dehydro-3-deoxygluconokinase n=1 Tax=Spirosoma oryzae TaxID=1469603 RepID=A0A2T0SAE3_9BACT|nr:sugar kinase [Spirosoma oryzae]PRY30394.1 2-dehydro-3-deoxygluconokinase [Spirosoma oryzae]